MSNENKNKFQILARTDSLTGIYNRYGFDESAEKMMDKNPKAHFVAALLDIDDFKFINDIYGHSSSVAEQGFLPDVRHNLWDILPG